MRRFGKLCFVDLAGSERLKETGGVGTASVRETGATPPPRPLDGEP
jgi:hypothetical protein